MFPLNLYIIRENRDFAPLGEMAVFVKVSVSLWKLRAFDVCFPVCFFELSTLQDQCLWCCLLLPLRFENIMQGKEALIWKERGWVALPNLLVFIIFIQCVCSTWGILDKTFIVGRGNKKKITKAVDVCECVPLNASTLRLYWSSCKNQNIRRKKWILTPRNNKRLHVFHIKSAITEEESL